MRLYPRRDATRRDAALELLPPAVRRCLYAPVIPPAAALIAAPSSTCGLAAAARGATTTWSETWSYQQRCLSDVSPSNGGEVDSAACYYSRIADGRRLHERTWTVRGLRANKGADHLADPLRATLPARARRTTTSPGADRTRPIDEGQRARSPPPKGAEVAQGLVPRRGTRAGPAGVIDTPADERAEARLRAASMAGAAAAAAAAAVPRIPASGGEGGGGDGRGVDGRPGARGRRAPDLLHLPTGACRRRSLPR